MGPGPHHHLPRVHVCSRCSFSSRVGRTQPTLTKSMKSRWFPRSSPACPAPREQPSVSAPSRKDFAGRWSRRRPTAPRRPDSRNRESAPAANGANGENRPRRAARPTAGNAPSRPGRPTAGNHTLSSTRPTASSQPRRPTASNHNRSLTGLTGLTARYRNRRLGRAGGPGGRPPGPAPRTGGKLAIGQRTARAVSWARRDLNPHVLSDTRT